MDGRGINTDTLFKCHLEIQNEQKYFISAEGVKKGRVLLASTTKLKSNKWVFYLKIKKKTESKPQCRENYISCL